MSQPSEHQTDLPKKRRRRLTTAVIFLTVVALVGVGVLVLWQRGNGRFSTVETAANDFRVPAGSVERPESALAYGRGFESYTCIDTSCPYVKRQWFVQVEEGEGPTFVESLIKQNGYSITYESRDDCPEEGTPCFARGAQGGVEVSADLLTLGQVPPPSQGIAPKEWRLLTITVRLE